MSDVWVVRWDTRGNETPCVLDTAGKPYAGPGLFRSASGGVVAFDGYLFDRAELEPTPARSDAAAVADAYERWKEALFEKISGGFTLAVWDPDRRCLLVARDAMGLHPCFYCCAGPLWLVSPSLDAILAQREVSRALNRVVIAEYLQDAVSMHQAGETFYEAVRRLPSAHALRIRRDSSSMWRYWDPVPPGFAWVSEDEMASFPSTLERAVGRCLTVGADSVALSGGFDSVSVAALAAAQRGERPPLHAVSFRFAGTECDEGEIQIAVAGALGMPQIIRTIDESLQGESFVDTALALSATSPSPVVSPWQSVYAGLFRSAADAGLSRLMMGTGGDDMLTVDLSYGADQLSCFNVAALWRFCRALQRYSPFPAARVARLVLWDGAAVPVFKGAARRTLERLSPGAAASVRRYRRQRALPAWSRPTDPSLCATVEERSANEPPIPMTPGEGAYARAMRRLPQAPLLMIQQDQSYFWARDRGFTLLFPYFDRGLVELSLRTPPEHLMSGGRVKAPLRRLVAERLPAVSMRTRKVDFTCIGDDVVRLSGERTRQALGRPTMLAELGLTDADRLSRMVDDFFAGRGHRWTDVWLALSTEMWLRARSTAQFS